MFADDLNFTLVFINEALFYILMEHANQILLHTTPQMLQK